MAFNVKRYISQAWGRITGDGNTRVAVQDVAEKLERLSRDLEAYIAEQVAAGIDDTFGDGLVLILTLGATCPSGWVEETSMRDLMVMGPDSTGASVGTAGGTDTHTHGSNALQMEQDDLYFDNVNLAAGAYDIAAHGHEHVITGSVDTTNWRPPFRRLLFCKRAA